MIALLIILGVFTAAGAAGFVLHRLITRAVAGRMSLKSLMMQVNAVPFFGFFYLLAVPCGGVVYALGARGLARDIALLAVVAFAGLGEQLVLSNLALADGLAARKGDWTRESRELLEQLQRHLGRWEWLLRRPLRKRGADIETIRKQLADALREGQ